MALAEQIRADLTAAMKARDAAKTSTLRMLQAAIKNEQIEKGGELEDADVIAVLKRAAKQRNDSVEQYEKAGRQDLADKEKAELVVLEAYMPQQMTDEELEALVKQTMTAVGAESKKDTGKVMKEIMARHRGTVDGKKVQAVLGRLLS
jgi:uncharacterized protein YqeY